MAKEKIGFEQFIEGVNIENREFVTNLQHELMNLGCSIQVKEAKSGYVVSYSFNKKTIFNYVFRKSGLVVRIYGNHINYYIELLENLPIEMKKCISKATNCKRLIDPSSCNQKCAMGYEFIMDGERFQKCRNNAFMFSANYKNNPYIKEFVLNEIENNL